MKEITLEQLDSKLLEMHRPLVSIIVAVYNIENYIEKCVDSLLKQTYSNLEIILVDDGSKDSSGKICDDFATKDGRVIVIHRPNGGLSAARNTGMDIAKGDYFAFVDGDDWIDADMYELMVNAAIQFEAELVACRYKCIYADRIVDMTTNKVVLYDGTEMLRDYLEENDHSIIRHAAWNKLYKRNLVNEERFPVGKLYEDVVFSAKMLSGVNKGVYLDCAKYNYVVERPGSIMAQGMNPKMFTDLLPAYLEKEEFLLALKDDLLVVLHRYYYLKKLISWYRQIEGQKKEISHEQCRTWKKMITEVFHTQKKSMNDIYKCYICSKNDMIKFKLFIICPEFYCRFMNINDRTILKLRLKLRRE